MIKLTAAALPENEQEYLKLLRINGQLQFENTQLKVSLASMGVERINYYEGESWDTHQNTNSEMKNIKKKTNKNYSRLHKSNHTGSLASDSYKMRLNKKGKLCLCNKIMLKSLSDPNIFF